MTDQNRLENQHDEIERAREALRAADALLGLGLHSDCVSRAYYAAFHYLAALLMHRGIEARTHAGALHLLNVEFVRPGWISSSHNRLLAGLQRSRELADYDSAVRFSREDAAAAVADAKAFGEDVLAYLRREGSIREEGEAKQSGGEVP